MIGENKSLKDASLLGARAVRAISETASRIPDAMKARGVLIGLTGRHGNCLKLRPPLVFTRDDVDITITAFRRVLAAL